MAVMEPEELEHWIHRAASAGIAAAAVHAIGTRRPRGAGRDRGQPGDFPAFGLLPDRARAANADKRTDVPRFRSCRSPPPCSRCTAPRTLMIFSGGPGPGYGWTIVAVVGAELVFGSDAPVEDPTVSWIHAAIAAPGTAPPRGGGSCTRSSPARRPFRLHPLRGPRLTRRTRRVRLGMLADFVRGTGTSSRWTRRRADTVVEAGGGLPDPLPARGLTPARGLVPCGVGVPGIPAAPAPVHRRGRRSRVALLTTSWSVDQLSLANFLDAAEFTAGRRSA
ncbi:hypothetical protein QJS66_10255 [Kocuria rhizophila]|nr:hypothetical protein QJS66_10255 [Kocuria rhizophila]